MSSELASVRATCACSRKLQHQARFRVLTAVLTAIACSASGARASLCLIPFRCFAMLERRMNPSWWILAALALLRTSWHLLYCCIQTYLILACAGAVTSGQPHHLAQGQKRGGRLLGWRAALVTQEPVGSPFVRCTSSLLTQRWPLPQARGRMAHCWNLPTPKPGL